MEVSSKDLQSSAKEDLPIFIKWMDFVKWLFVTTDSFPKKARFTFIDRLTKLAFDVVEDMIEARYSKNKGFVLKKANVNLEKIRVLLRICYECRYLSKKSYEYSAYSINEVGKMLGGWIKQQGFYEKTRESV